MNHLTPQSKSCQPQGTPRGGMIGSINMSGTLLERLDYSICMQIIGVLWVVIPVPCAYLYTQHIMVHIPHTTSCLFGSF